MTVECYCLLKKIFSNWFVYSLYFLLNATITLSTKVHLITNAHVMIAPIANIEHFKLCVNDRNAEHRQVALRPKLAPRQHL